MEVSILVPCFNEEKHILKLLNALKCQTFPSVKMEIIIVDGMSTDATRKIIDKFVKDNPAQKIKLLENPARIIPAAINIAAKVASGKYLIRMDAHAFPSPDYVERCVADLEKNIGDNIGGVWTIVPGEDTWVGHSIAEAAAHPLGVGDALYRFTRSSGFVDTVPFGAFRRNLFFEVGGFDEKLHVNEDYDFNARLRDKGYRIFLDANIRVSYAARATLRLLAQQYFRYGFWKYRMLRKAPKTLRLRQALPPLFVFFMTFFLVLSFFSSQIKTLFLILVGIYFIVLLFFSLRQSIKKRRLSLIVGMPLAIATMHISWGSGFLYSLATSSLVE